eukprot:5345022-Pleurochrysis_carterae.AAC.1
MPPSKAVTLCLPVLRISSAPDIKPSALRCSVWNRVRQRSCDRTSGASKNVLALAFRSTGLVSFNRNSAQNISTGSASGGMVCKSWLSTEAGWLPAVGFGVGGGVGGGSATGCCARVSSEQRSECNQPGVARMDGHSRRSCGTDGRWPTARRLD